MSDQPPSPSLAPVQQLSAEDLALLKQYSDRDGDGLISFTELQQLVNDYNAKRITDERILSVLRKYDVNNDGHIDLDETHALHHQVSLQETGARYAGYSLVAARAFRYLAFTSDFGEALRPVVSARLVSGSYAVAFGYCFVDVGYEAYKHVKRGYVTEKLEPQPLTQVVVERAAFQALASLALPAFLIHSTVSVAKKVCARIGRFQRWGPSIAGLAFIPLLPLYLDEPVEHAIEWSFHRYGPWSHGADKPKQH
jgi:mitochondrial fission process protein 1